MHWLIKTCRSEKDRIQYNIDRLTRLRSDVKSLAYFVVASQSGGFQVLSDLIERNIVTAHPIIYDKLKSALIGENNSKIALDSPMKFQTIMKEALSLIDIEIGKQRKELHKLEKPQQKWS